MKNCKWSKSLPVKDGFYWHRVKGERPQVVQVMLDDDCTIVAYECGWDGCLLAFEDAEWFGPLQLPQE